jgi:Cu2+-exporting ATPase
MVGTGLGAKRGVLFKNATALETSAHLDTVVADGLNDQLLALAAAVERESEHPLAQAIARHADEAGVAKVSATAFRNIPGHGAHWDRSRQAEEAEDAED